MPCLTQATPACELVPLRVPTWVLSLSWSMDAIDRVVMNLRLHYLGMAARIVNPMLKPALITCMDARLDPSAVLGLRPGDAHIIRNAGGRASHDAMHDRHTSAGRKTPRGRDRRTSAGRKRLRARSSL